MDLVRNKYITYNLLDGFFFEDNCNPTGEWLEQAKRFDQYLISTAPHMITVRNRIFDEIKDSITIRVSEKRLKQTLTTVLMNLFMNCVTGVPIRFSKDRNLYTWDKTYGKLHMKYAPLMAVVTELNKKGYKIESSFIYDEDRNFGRQTRMWASNKFMSMIRKTPIHHPYKINTDKPAQIIQLKNKDKKLINFKNTPRVRRMTKHLRLYNDFISKHQISVRTDDTPNISFNNLREILTNSYKDVITIKEVQVEVKNNKYIIESSYTITQTCAEVINDYKGLKPLFSYSDFKSTACIQDAICHQTNDEKRSQIFDIYIENDMACVVINGNELVFDIKKVPYHLYDAEYQYESTVYSDNEYQRQALLGLIIRGFQKAYGYNKDEIEKERPLSDFGIDGIEFEINNSRLHRVFNLNSFNLGGRFFGAYHETMPKKLRPFIHINNEPTIEPDFAAHHVRLLYHKAGIDYRECPYLALTSNPDERDVLKRLVLIALNTTENKAIWSFIEDAKERFNKDFSYPYVKDLLQKFRAVHSRIADNVHNVGRELQNIDSKITEAILMRMVEMEIPCLPVHDSYIVARQYENTLREVMTNEYMKLIGFKPVIG